MRTQEKFYIGMAKNAVIGLQIALFVKNVKIKGVKIFV